MSLTQYLVQQNIFATTPFFLTDVGAAGGIADYWSIFENALHAVGFEPLVNECTKLNKARQSKNIVYHPYFIIAEKKDIDIDSQDSYACSLFSRSTAWLPEHAVPSSSTPEYAKEKISLDHFFSENSLENPDFVKVDTDGFDYQVLRGAEKICSNPSTLGFHIECQLHGSSSPHSNTFRNIDRYLVEQGYTLYSLIPWKYSKKTLPAPFCYDFFGQTQKGQMYWADALYLKDLVNTDLQLSPHQILKLACIHEIFGLQDCAAELLLHYKNILSPITSIDSCLDQLMKSSSLNMPYQDYIQQFNADPRSFFPSNHKP